MPDESLRGEIPPGPVRSRDISAELVRERVLSLGPDDFKQLGELGELFRSSSTSMFSSDVDESEDCDDEGLPDGSGCRVTPARLRT